MNRQYTQFQLSLEKRNIMLWAQVAIGATGAPTLNAARSKGIASIARTGAGAYTITFQDKYVGLLFASHVLQLAAGAPSSVGGMILRAVNVNAATPTVEVLFVDGAGAGVELNNGATVYLKFEMKGSTV